MTNVSRVRWGIALVLLGVFAGLGLLWAEVFSGEFSAQVEVAWGATAIVVGFIGLVLALSGADLSC